MDCIFCKIVAGQIPCKKVYEDGQILAFEDIAPKAPVHVLLVPKRHVATLDDTAEGDRDLLGDMTLRAAQIARDRGVEKSGYRVLVNCNPEGGQEVFHLHMHLLGGRQMRGMG